MIASRCGEAADDGEERRIISRRQRRVEEKHQTMATTKGIEAAHDSDDLNINLEGVRCKY